MYNVDGNIFYKFNMDGGDIDGIEKWRLNLPCEVLIGLTI